MLETVFNVVEAAEEYSDEAGYSNSIIQPDVKIAFQAGAQWAFEQIKNQILKDNIKEG